MDYSEENILETSFTNLKSQDESFMHEADEEEKHCNEESTYSNSAYRAHSSYSFDFPSPGKTKPRANLNKVKIVGE
jgi:hypothetical protein